MTELVCPFKVYKFYPILESQILIVLSRDPLTIYVPSGEKQTEVTIQVCPIKSGLIPNLIPFRFVLVKLVFLSYVLIRLTLVRFALVKLALLKFPFLIFAP